MWNGCIDHDPSGQILSAWIAKEELRALCATAARGGHRHNISDRLWRFYRWCADADIPELTTLAETIDTWWPAIEVFLTTRLTNARTEGTNRLIKQVKRAACGFRNRDNYRRRVRLHCTRHTPADCQRGNRQCPPKIEEPTKWRPVHSQCAERRPLGSEGGCAERPEFMLPTRESGPRRQPTRSTLASGPPGFRSSWADVEGESVG